MPGVGESKKPSVSFNKKKFATMASPCSCATFTEPVTGMQFIWVAGGCFQMGSNEGDDDEKPIHKVVVDGFWMGKYEVTQGQWLKIMGNNPSRFKKGDDYPVENISWHDCQEFIRRINAKSRRKFRLPTEAEWEYACCSGGKAEKYSGGNDVDRVAWYYGNIEGHTHVVGRKAANGVGLYDMSGNVCEWCADWYGENYYLHCKRKNPCGPGSGLSRVNRGGSWYDFPWRVRSANRYGGRPGIRNDFLGVRLVLVDPFGFK
jgi:formylglycine-generating enzyme required for sulfatase activity